MSLYEKIISLYPSLTINDFYPNGGIIIQNDGDGTGDYIAKWDHLTLTQPTQDQLEM